MRAEHIFIAASELKDPAQRRAYLDRVCADNGALREEVDRLLESAPPDEPIAAAADAATTTGNLATDVPPVARAGADSSKTSILNSLAEKPGDRIGRYKLLEQIGEGGMGSVWMAEQDEPVRRRVALKIIKLGMDTREVVARFEAERQALALMDHPNIARVFDGGAGESGRPYFVMELVRGIPLTQYCDEARLSIRERLGLFVLICQAVQHAHQKGIIHRDLKPSNILVRLHDGVPVPKIIDFGIAKATDQRLTDKTLFTRFQQFLGTPAYMSPEQAVMSGLDVDTRSDIYSLGVLLYELLIGRTPFESKELLESGLDEMRRTIREREPLRPSTRLSGLPPAELTTMAQRRQTEPPKLIASLRGDLDWIAMKCLEKDRTRRYETANGLALDLRRYLKSEPVLARPPSRVYRLQKLARRNRLAFTAAAVVLAALFAALGVSTYSLAKERMARTRAETAEQAQARLRQEAESAREGEKRERLRAEERELTARQHLYIVDMNLAQLALQANDRQRANMLLERNVPERGQKDLRGWEWRYFWQSARSEELFTLGYHSNVVTSLAVSPDGKLLISGSYDTTVKAWDLESRRQIASVRAGASIHTLAFSPDGNTFASGDSVGVKLWKKDPIEIVVRLQPDGLVRSLAYSPDGRRLAAYTASGIRVWSLTNRLEELHFAVDGLNGSLRGALAYSPDGQLLAVGEDRGHIHLFNANNGLERNDLPGHRDSVTGLIFLPDSRGLVSTCWDSSVNRWDLDSRRTVLAFTNHTAWTTCPVLSPDGKMLATASADQTANLWDVETGALLTTLRGHLGEVWALVFLPDGQRLVTAGKDDAIKVWGVASPRDAQMAVLPDFRDVQFSPDGRTVAVTSAGANAVVTVADLQSTNGYQSLVDQRSGIHALRFSTDGRYLATGDNSGRVQLWDPATRREVRRLAEHGAPIQRLSFSKDGSTICSLDSRGGYKRLDLATGGETAAGQLPVAVRYGIVAFTPDLAFVAMADDSSVVLFELARAVRVATFFGHRELVRGLAYSPDGRWLASASEDATVRVWDVAASRQVALLRGHRNGAFALSFSPDGTRLASTGGEGLVKLWDTATWQEAATLTGPRKLDAVGFAPDGRTLLAKSERSGWRVWRAAGLDEIAAESRGLPSLARKLALASVRTLPTAGPARPAANPAPGSISRPEQVYVPPRASAASSNLIDLTRFYNVGLTDRWAPSLNLGRLSSKTFVTLAPGLQILDGVRFDVRGLVQLHSTTFGQRGLDYPTNVSNIPIAQSCAALHFLHATAWDDVDGTSLGHYEVHFEDGTSEKVPLVYGRDVRNWDSWGDPSVTLAGSAFAWYGTNLIQTVDGPRPFIARLSKTSWRNPRPGTLVRSLDFVSALSAAGPFLVAVTVE